MRISVAVQRESAASSPSSTPSIIESTKVTPVEIHDQRARARVDCLVERITQDRRCVQVGFAVQADDGDVSVTGSDSTSSRCASGEL